MGKFIAGTLFGIVLSVSYVWYDVDLPDWIRLPEMFQSGLKAALTQDTLVAQDAPADQRLRALEVYFASQPKRAANLDRQLGHPHLNALTFAYVRRKARQLDTKWTAYQKGLDAPSIRAALVRKHGTSDDALLKRRMLLLDLLDQPHLHQWLTHHRTTPTVQNVRELIVELARQPIPPAQR